MKRTPLVDAPLQVHIESGPLAGRDVLISDFAPETLWSKMPIGTIVIRRRGGYTTQLTSNGGESRAWYALAPALVEEAAIYLREQHPSTYNLIEWWGS